LAHIHEVDLQVASDWLKAPGEKRKITAATTPNLARDALIAKLSRLLPPLTDAILYYFPSSKLQDLASTSIPPRCGTFSEINQAPDEH
jgi:hypothetical protein